MCSKFAAISLMIAAALAVSSKFLEAMPVYGSNKQLPWPRSGTPRSSSRTRR